MKNLLIAILLFPFFLNGQTLVKPLYLKGGGNITGAYYKDLDNDFERFAGTWVYSEGGINFKITFKKKQQVFIDQYNAYYDFLIGEYRYAVNGIEKINTLGLIDTPMDIRQHSITGISIVKPGTAPVCNDCLQNEHRVICDFKDPERPGIMQGLTARAVFRRVDSQGVQKIQLILRQTGSVIPDENGVYGPNSFNVPWGTYILTKVE